MAAFKKSKGVELFWLIHRKVLGWTGGRVGGSLQGMAVLMLTTKGRRSGAQRSVPLTYIPHGDAFVVIASYLGEPNHPAWWLNLSANSEAKVEIKGESIAVRARQAEDAERETLWDQVVAVNADYAEYKTRTTRTIPVVVLDRA
ncbi:MAG: deazaflavin-dependent oxidoreductase (nitroreductase family) [Hyphomicrobiaceae bacterium]|jgi:deazaflavin-dependent oxidoreductase (nitroreductase family)